MDRKIDTAALIASALAFDRAAKAFSESCYTQFIHKMDMPDSDNSLPNSAGPIAKLAGHHGGKRRRRY